MQILIVDGPKVLVHADIDVPRRKVVSLLMEDGALLRAAFIGLALLDSYIVEGMANGTDRADGTHQDPLVIVGSEGEAKELSDTRLEPALTLEQMVKAMGLLPCSTTAGIVCEMCDECYASAYRRKGQVLIGWCAGCLPAAFERHMREQADLDRLVEADEPERANRTERPDAPICEGGCE